jgi:TolB-like protein/DNA-binding winged helix-turn-helix (wHTH) protein
MGMEMPASSDVFLFGDFRLDRRAGGLFRHDHGADTYVEIGSRALDILGLLVARAGKIVSKDEIIATVWPGTVVEVSNLTVQISALRRVIDRRRSQGSCIQTVPGRGYRFVGAVQPVAEAPSPPSLADNAPLLVAPSPIDGSAPKSVASANGPPELPNKPSIAVLPFANMSADPEQEYFADGMVEEIITALSRVRWLFVIARNSSFTYKGQAVDVKEVGRELGVRYILEGSIRKAGGRVRIAAQLIDAINGAHLWADRFDGLLQDVFELQDRVASNVAGVIVKALQAVEAARSAARPTNDLTAYDLYLRAYAMVRSSSKQIHEALRLMEQAIERDPHYGPALAWAAVCCVRLLTDGRSEDRSGDTLKGADFARRAIEVAGDDAGVLANAALALAYFGEDVDAMISLVDRALALNPSFARGWHTSGVLRIWAGQTDVAIEHIETSLRLNPRGRTGMSFFVIGAAHFFNRRFDQAVPSLLRPIQEDSSFVLPYHWLAACYAHMGRFADARSIIRRLRSITPIVVPDASYLRNPEHLELLLSGLRLAAGEEHQSDPQDRSCL